MNNKDKLKALSALKEKMEKKVSMIKENKAKTGVAYLIESELEKAELVLATKSVLDRLQRMAEDVAKVEADDVMPIIDALRETFGPEMADGFNKAATEALRSTTEAIKSAKDVIGSQVARFEAAVNGEPVNDMAMEPAPAADPAMGDDAALAPDAMADGDDAVTPDAEVSPEGDAAMAPDEGDDIFGSEDDAVGAAGRAKKESAHLVPKGAKALREAKNPDTLILATFAKQIREGAAARIAAMSVAEHYGIDVSDVVEIVRGMVTEERKGLTAARKELAPLGMVITHDGTEFRVNFKGGKEASAYYTDDVEDAIGTAKDMAKRKVKEGKKKPDADKDGVPNWADKNPFKKGGEKDRKKVKEQYFGQNEDGSQDESVKPVLELDNGFAWFHDEEGDLFFQLRQRNGDRWKSTGVSVSVRDGSPRGDAGKYAAQVAALKKFRGLGESRKPSQKKG